MHGTRRMILGVQNLQSSAPRSVTSAGYKVRLWKMFMPPAFLDPSTPTSPMVSELKPTPDGTPALNKEEPLSNPSQEV